MDLDPAGKFGFKVGDETVGLEVFRCDVGDRSYYAAKIQRACFERVSAALGDDPLVDSREFDDRREPFPNNAEAFASKSEVVISAGDGDGEILKREIVDFGRRAFWSLRIRDVAKNTSTLIKEVFDENPDSNEVFVMVDARGENQADFFKGVIPDKEDTGDF